MPFGNKTSSAAKSIIKSPLAIFSALLTDFVLPKLELLTMKWIVGWSINHFSMTLFELSVLQSSMIINSMDE